ncbi:MAG: thiamine pyrophosphate-binding protein [Haloglomus sp.]
MPETIPATTGIVDLLLARGVDTVFSLASEEIIPLLSEIEDERGDEIGVVQCRHEQGAAAMADGYARASGDVGVCVVGRGPAIAQTGTALVSANRHRSKVLYVVPESRRTAAHDGKAFDQSGFLDRIAGDVESIRAPERVVPGLNDAFRRLQNGHGPVALQIPIDVLESDVPADVPVGTQTDWRAGARVEPDDAAVSRAVDAYRDADPSAAPVVVAGRGAVRADAREAIERLAERLGAYLATTIPAIGYFADHPYALGPAGGLGAPVANEHIAASDVVFGVGAGLNHHTLDALDPVDTCVVHVDTDPAHVGRYTDVDVGVVGDARATADALHAELERRGVDDSERFWTADARREIAASSPLSDGPFTDVPGLIDPRELVAALDDALPAGRLVVADVGQYIGWVFDGLTFGRNDRLLWAVDFLALGQGLPVGVGAAMAERERICVVFCGDEGLMMILQELETAARHDVPVVVVVVDDEALGAEYHMGRIRGHSGSVGRIPSPDFDAVTAALGAESHVVRSAADVADLEPELAGDLTGPLVLDCRVDPDVVHRAMGEMDID